MSSVVNQHMLPWCFYRIFIYIFLFHPQLIKLDDATFGIWIWQSRIVVMKYITYLISGFTSLNANLIYLNPWTVLCGYAFSRSWRKNTSLHVPAISKGMCRCQKISEASSQSYGLKARVMLIPLFCNFVHYYSLFHYFILKYFAERSVYPSDIVF